MHLCHVFILKREDGQFDFEMQANRVSSFVYYLFTNSTSNIRKSVNLALELDLGVYKHIFLHLD